MRAKKYLFSTLKEIPNNSDCTSHILMLRAGIIRQSTSGTYIWLPTGLRILKKVINIIRKEMEKCEAMEISKPFLQKKKIWDISKRFNEYGKELFQIKDRNNKKFILGPTYEEFITCFMKNEIQSYKQLPLILYQIQTKFRDEIRPRFGTIRTKEFIMKDAYSFHLDSTSLEKTYTIIYNAYVRIFQKMKLKFYAVKADSGIMGGIKSHEFQAPSSNGENTIVISTKSNYATNIQVENTITSQTQKSTIDNHHFEFTKILSTHEKISKKLSTIPNSLRANFIKTILIKTKKNSKYSFLALLIQGNQVIDEKKISKINIISNPLKFASNEEILSITGTTSKFIGPINLNLPILADYSIANLKNFTIGSNITNQYFNNMNWNKDISFPKIYDIRYILENRFNPNDTGELKIKNSIEIAHIFQIGKKYSKIMNMKVQNEIGKKQVLTMGCYGIGIARTISAVIEQNHDQNGIIWPSSIAPFEIAIIPINFYESKLVKIQSEKIYHFCKKHGIEVILDDRKNTLGTKLSEMELIGIPNSIIVSEKLLENNTIEYRQRHHREKKIITINEILKKISHKFIEK